MATSCFWEFYKHTLHDSPKRTYLSIYIFNIHMLWDKSNIILTKPGWNEIALARWHTLHPRRPSTSTKNTFFPLQLFLNKFHTLWKKWERSLEQSLKSYKSINSLKKTVLSLDRQFIRANLDVSIEASVEKPSVTVQGSQIGHFCKRQTADYIGHQKTDIGNWFLIYSCTPQTSEFYQFRISYKSSRLFYDCTELLAATRWASLRRIRMWCSSLSPASLTLASFKDDTRPSVSKPAAISGAQYMGIPIDTSQSETELTWTGDTGLRPPEGICREII